jgi:hypothetical protein
MGKAKAKEKPKRVPFRVGTGRMSLDPGRRATIERDNAAFEHVFKFIAAGFDMRKPDAMARALSALGDVKAREKAERDPVWKADVWPQRGRRLELLVAEHANYWLHPADLGGTPETMSRPTRFDPVEYLYVNGDIDDAQRRAAIRMAQVVESVTSSMGAKAQNLTRTPSSPGGSDRTAFEYADVYLPWARDQRRQQRDGRRHLDIVLDVVVWRLSLGRARAKWRMSHPRALQFVTDGLADYAEALDRYQKGEVATIVPARSAN